MSPKIDIFITMKMPDWTYSTEYIPGQVFFYPVDETTGETGVAFSSQEAGDSIEEVWGNVEANFAENLPGFEFMQEEDVVVGKYTGSRYSFTSDLVYGDYIMWNTKDKLFICTFTAREDEYDDLLAKLLESLKSFEVLSEMQ